MYYFLAKEIHHNNRRNDREIIEVYKGQKSALNAFVKHKESVRLGKEAGEFFIIYGKKSLLHFFLGDNKEIKNNLKKFGIKF